MTEKSEQLSPGWGYRIVLVLLVASFAALLIPSSGKMLYSGDDDDYFAVASAIAFGKFPSFRKEFHAGEVMPFASVGPGLLASPFVAAASLMDRREKAPITVARTRENREGSWALLGFYLSTQAYLAASALLMFSFVSKWTDRRTAFFATSLVILGGGGIAIYAFVRPIMSHVYEFFSITLALWSLTRLHQGAQGRRYWVLFSIAATLVFLTRYNNAPIALAMFLVPAWWMIRGKARFSDYALACGLSVAILFITRVLPIIVNGYSSADQSYLDAGTRLLALHDAMFYVERMNQIFLGTDMGLVFTAPAVLLAIAGLFLARRDVPVWHTMIAALFAINLFFVAQWCSAGSFFGYRYFVFTTAPLLVLYLARLIKPVVSSVSLVSSGILLVLLCWLPVASVIAFGLPNGYYLDAVNTMCGFPAYGNPDYQINVIRVLGYDAVKFFSLAYDRSLGAFLAASGMDSGNFSKLKSDRQVRQLTMLYGFSLLMVLATVLWPPLYGLWLKRARSNRKNK